MVRPTVQFPTASLPTPPCAAGEIRFRRGLTIDDVQQKLQYFGSTVFGDSQTKDFQNKVLQRVFNGEHVLGISATGSGKSFCFWLPALLRPGLPDSLSVALIDARPASELAPVRHCLC